MFIDSTGKLYGGDMNPGDREATQAEIDAHKTEVAKNLLSITLEGIEVDYETQMKECVEYGGHYYKPSYVTKLSDLLLEDSQIKQLDPEATIFPIKIKDASKLDENAVLMTRDELLKLIIFLRSRAKEIWEIKATKENNLVR